MQNQSNAEYGFKIIIFFLILYPAFLTNFNQNLALNMLVIAGIYRNLQFNLVKICQNSIKQKILNNLQKK